MKREYIHSKKLRNSANGAPCMVNSPECNYNNETTVLAHIDSSKFGKATGIKGDDTAAAYACSSCHDFLALNAMTDAEYRYILHCEAAIRTTAHMINNGVLKIA